MQRPPLPRASVTTGRFSPASRVGVTLVEVLISLLVMSVAVVSVATLFPLSLLRSVRARQLTQATILRYNAENQLDLHSGLANGLPQGRPAILDPLGWHLINELGLGLQNSFGGLVRTNGNTSTVEAARKLVSLPDTWINTARGIPINYDPAVPSLTLPIDVDLVDVPFTPLGISRVTVFDATARFSDVRIITFIDVPSKTIQLSSTLSPRVLANLGEARIEILEQRYTWLLTVRRSVRSADVVVFFRRAFSTEDEQIYLDRSDSETFFNPILAGKPNRRIKIKWSGGADNKPFMRRNGFVFDVQNALWYRIHKIEYQDDNETSPAVLVLDQVIKQKGTGGAMLMRGVVEVYPISF